MSFVTKLDIVLEIDPAIGTIQDAVAALPGYSAASFVQFADGRWHGDFIITCPVAPLLAEGDFVDNFAPYFKALLDLKTFYAAQYEFHIAVGPPSAETFDLDASSVALLAALGAPIMVRRNPAG